MNLGKQIHTLLKRQAQVYVKNLGSFKRIHTSATFDEKRKVYLPPLTYIEFDKDSTAGYDFVQYVQQVHQIEVADAENLVFEAVNKVFTSISKDGQALLDSLGYLVSFGNSYVFKPLDLSGFHYEPIEDHLIDQYKVNEIGDDNDLAGNIEEKQESDDLVEIVEDSTENIQDEVDKTEVDSVVVEETKTQSKQQTLDQPKNNYANTYTNHYQEEPKKSNAGAYVFLAILALAILGGVYYYMNYMNQPVTYIDENYYAEDTTLLQVDSTNIHQGIDSTLLTHADSVAKSLHTDTVQVEEKQEAKQEKDEVKKFTIIIGTHKTLAQAYDQADAYHKDGHKNVRVITPNLAKNFKRVVWDTYGTKEERDSALRYVQKHIIADAWPDVLK